MKKSKLLFTVIGGLTCSLCLGGALYQPQTAQASATEVSPVVQFYNERTMTKEGTTDELSYSGLTPYGTGKISLGTYDMTAANNLSSPLFEILPYKEWKTSATVATSDSMFFTVYVNAGEKQVVYRFGKDARTDGTNNTAVFIGDTKDTAEAHNVTASYDALLYPITRLPFRYDGTVSRTDVKGADGTTSITAPTPVAFYYYDGQYNGEYYMNQGVCGAKGVKKEVSEGSGEYRYAMTCEWGGPRLKAADLKNVEISIEFDNAPATQEESWVTFTSIGGNDFKEDVRYETWGGTIVSTDYTTSYTPLDTSIQTLPTEVNKQHEQFSHWYYGNDSANVVNDAGFAAWLAEQTGAITLSAHYVPYEYDVAYDLNYAGAPTITADVVTYLNYQSYEMKSVAFASYPQGKIFDGWYTQATGGTKVEGLSSLENLTVYAHWVDGYLVTVDDGQSTQTFPVKAGECVTEPTAPQKTGYRFDGWKYNETIYDFSTPVNSNINLVASYSVITYTLSFYAEGEKVQDTSVAYGQKLTALPTIPEKAGHTVGGWYCGNEQITTDTAISGNMEIVAVYVKNNYTVTFEVDGGSAVAAMTVAYGETVDGNAVTTQKTGYDLVGWTCNGASFDFSTAITDNVTLTAVWKVKEYKISIFQNGSEIGSITKKHGEQVSLQELATATGKEISAAYVDGSLTTAYDFTAAITGDLSVYVPYAGGEAAPEEGGCNSSVALGGTVGLITLACCLAYTFKERNKR